MNTKVIEVEGISMLVSRKSIKNLYIRVIPPDGHVEISAPLKMSDERIMNAIMLRLEWIKSKQVQKTAEECEADVFALWGNKERLRVSESVAFGKVGVDECGYYVGIGGKEMSAELKAGAIEIVYRYELQKALDAMVHECEALAGKCAQWKPRKMKSRWGSCNTRSGLIFISIYLAAKPPQCLKMVMLHELLHLTYPNHGAEFYSALAQLCPDWKAWKKLL